MIKTSYVTVGGMARDICNDRATHLSASQYNNFFVKYYLDWMDDKSVPISVKCSKSKQSSTHTLTVDTVDYSPGDSTIHKSYMVLKQSSVSITMWRNAVQLRNECWRSSTSVATGNLLSLQYFKDASLLKGNLDKRFFRSEKLFYNNAKAGSQNLCCSY